MATLFGWKFEEKKAQMKNNRKFRLRWMMEQHVNAKEMFATYLPTALFKVSMTSLLDIAQWSCTLNVN